MEKCSICELWMSHVNRRSVCTPIQQQVERQTEAPVPRCYPRLEKSFISTTNQRTPWRKKGVDLTSPVLQDRWLYFSRWIFFADFTPLISSCYTFWEWHHPHTIAICHRYAVLEYERIHPKNFLRWYSDMERGWITNKDWETRGKAGCESTRSKHCGVEFQTWSGEAPIGTRASCGLCN